MTDSITEAIPTGSKWRHQGSIKRAHRTTVELKGVAIEVEYVLDGEYLEATDIDDACTPTATVKNAQIGGVNCLQLLDRDELAELVERQVLR